MKPAQNTVPQSKVPSSRSGEKVPHCILIYEDDPEILMLCKLLLTKEKYRVEALPRCHDVINDISRTHPDLILMDLWIPDIGGEKAVALIKNNAACRHIPVLLFSANAQIREICKKVKADGYIEKPFDLKTFKKTIARYILA